LFFGGVCYESNFLANDGTLAGTISAVVIHKDCAMILLATFWRHRSIQWAGIALGGGASLANVLSMTIGAIYGSA
jgi:hypothetical protein